MLTPSDGVLMDEIVRQIRERINLSLCIEKMSDELDHLRTGYAKIINDKNLSPRDMEKLGELHAIMLKLSRDKAQLIKARYRGL
jgi:hypothetical protein